MVSINFASRNYRFIERMHAALAVLNGLLLITMGVTVWFALSLRGEIGAVRNKVKEIEAAEQQVRPLLAERDRLIKDLNAMSGLIESKRFSWTQMYTTVERVFPIGVAAEKIEYNPRDHSLALEGTAQSPESLRNLMIGLERSSAFKDAYLKHQSVDKGSISFNVAAFYYEIKSAGVDGK